MFKCHSFSFLFSCGVSLEGGEEEVLSAGEQVHDLKGGLVNETELY
jgi:hypothetical protein